MIPLTLAEVAAVTKGTLRSADPSSVMTAPAVVDSRLVEPGSLFVAVRGEHADGHDFAVKAVQAGAVAVLATKDVGVASVVVEDTVGALGRLASEVARRATGCTVIGVTGSQGKTGTKDLLDQVLARVGETVATNASFNNEIGGPLTVLRATEQTRFLVAEMGARAAGNIAYLCRIAKPTVGVVLNVGIAHLGEFGTSENIARAKGELVEALPPDGFAVLNADDDAVAAMAARTRAQVVTFGSAPDAAVGVRDLLLGSDGEPRFDLEYAGRRAHVHLPLLGRHQAYNAAAAAAVAVSLGLDLADVAAALGGVELRSEWRMEKHRRRDGVLVVNDSYNANPDSMRAALTTVASMASRDRTRTTAVLGEMLELGAGSVAEHEAVGRLAVELGVDQVVVVGPGASGIHDGAIARGGRSVHLADADAAIAWVGAALRPGDLILVKASRAAGLERVASALLNPAGDNAPGTASVHGVPAQRVDREGDEGKNAR